MNINRKAFLKKRITLKKGFVCVLDALGIKGIWSNEDPKMSISLFLTLKEAINDVIKKNPAYNEAHFDFFSDTAIITYLDDSKNDEGFILLAHEFAKLILSFYTLAMTLGIKYRGSIAYGNFYKSKEFIIGPAIDDAANYYDKYDWIGISCTLKTSYLLKSKGIPIDKKINDEFEYCLYYFDYNIPVNSKLNLQSCTLLTLNWPYFLIKSKIRLSDSSPFLKTLYESFSNTTIPFDATVKYKNTIDYFDKCMVFIKTALEKIKEKDKNTTVT